jgi:hypothetical protein
MLWNLKFQSNNITLKNCEGMKPHIQQPILLPHLKSQTRTPLCFLSSTGAIKTVKRNFSHSYWLSFMLQKTSHSPRWSKCRCPEAFRSMYVIKNFIFQIKFSEICRWKKLHCLAGGNLFLIIRKFTTFYGINLNASAINWKSEPKKILFSQEFVTWKLLFGGMQIV